MRSAWGVFYLRMGVTLSKRHALRTQSQSVLRGFALSSSCSSVKTGVLPLLRFARNYRLGKSSNCFFLHVTYFTLAIASRARASWSGQEVPFMPHSMPFSRVATSSGRMPRTSAEIPCRLPLHPPSKLTEAMRPSSSKVRWMLRLQTPCVRMSYVFMWQGFFMCKCFTSELWNCVHAAVS